MKRMICLFTALLVIVMPIVAMAQNYTVQPGDTAWDLARKYYDNPMVWQRIVDMNPFLQEPGRVFEKDGKIILLLKEGKDQLVGLERLGVEPPKAVPVKEFILTATATTPVQQDNEFGLLSWLVIVPIAALAIIWLLKRRERELRRDPVTSGPPIIAGGVRPDETDRLIQAMEVAAVNEYARLNPGVDRNTIRVERIGPIEDGMISGSGMVGFADRPRPRTINPPLPGYQARFRFPDGREDFLQSLQGCMNPCYYGEGMTGFTFTPNRQIVPIPTPPAPAPQPIPHPTVAVQRIREGAQVRGENTLTLGDEIMVFPQGYHLTVDPETNTIRLDAPAVEMILSPKKVSKPKTRQIAKSTSA